MSDPTNNPVFDIHIFGLGCLGAIAPEIVRLYDLRHGDQANWTSKYLIPVAMYAGLGGVIAWLLQSSTYLAAFYNGATMPILMNTIMKRIKKTAGGRQPHGQGEHGSKERGLVGVDKQGAAPEQRSDGNVVEQDEDLVGPDDSVIRRSWFDDYLHAL